MRLEPHRLIIRDLEMEDVLPFVKMATDGSLKDCSFGKECSSWMADWVTEAKEFVVRDNPQKDYLAYTITLKDEKNVVGAIGCTWYEDLQEIGITYFIGAQ